MGCAGRLAARRPPLTPATHVALAGALSLAHGLYGEAERSMGRRRRRPGGPALGARRGACLPSPARRASSAPRAPGSGSVKAALLIVMRLKQVLFSQGFGTRRECEALVWHGMVQLGDRVLDDPDEELPTDGLVIDVRGQPWPFHAKALVMMNKPAGYECSRKPRHHPSVLSLLPAPLRQREVQPIGRLDEDTTGLLLFTDDGALMHKLSSPKCHVPKVYVADCAEAVSVEQVAQLLGGVVLHDDPLPVRAAACAAVAERQLRLTLTEGKYHQVKRMIAAAGNHVLTLHREAYGALPLPADLAPGHWRWVAREAIAPDL